MQPSIAPSFNDRLLLAASATAPRWLAALVLGALLSAAPSAPSLAQNAPAAAAAPNAPAAMVQPGPQAVPGFWDPRRRPERPDLAKVTVIRFLTETDYPPFNFTGPDGNPAGFNVELARMLCEEIKATCTVQMRRFETLLDAIASNRGDAIIASLAVTAQTRSRLDFTDPYYRAPARFASRKDGVLIEMRPELLEGKKVGAIAGSSHEAYLKALFTDASCAPMPMTTRCAPPCAAARSISFSATRFRWRSGSTAPIQKIAALSRAVRSSKAVISARASASASARAMIFCGKR